MHTHSVAGPTAWNRLPDHAKNTIVSKVKIIIIIIIIIIILPEVPWIPQALQKLSGDFKTKCILGWLRLVKILLLKRAIKGNSVKTLDSDGKALVKIACFSRISGCTS